jgi:RHS repeat-associated protein
VFRADPTPTEFNGSVLVWNGNGWDARLRDGTTYVFGDEAPLQAIRDRFGNTVTITRAPAPADPDGKVRSRGPITQVTSPNGKWIAFTNNAANQVTQARDNAGRTIGYTYDGTGHLSTVTDATGAVTTYTYDSAGRMATAEDGRGTVYLTNTYDTAGRVKTQIGPDTGLHTFDYVTSAGGKITETRVTDPRGFVRKVTFNTSGFSTSDTAAFGNALARTTTITRDPVTNVVTSTTDPLGRRTDLGYDAFGHVTSITQVVGTSSARTMQARYEGPFDQVSKITDWLGKDTVYGYHPNGALKTVADPLGRTTTTDVLETGEVKTVTDTAGKNTGYAYALGDLVTVTDPLGRASRLASDTIGQLVAVRDPAGTISRSTYDKQGRVLSSVDPLGRSTSYTYDPNGNLKTVTDPRTKTTTYTYDLMSRVKTVTDPLNRVTTYDYDLNGNPTSSTSARGKITLTEFDALNRPNLVRFGATGATEESRTTYGYDLADRLKTVTDSAAGVTTFTLNDRDQLTKSVTPQGTLDYTYDAAHRTTMTAPGQSPVVYGYNDASQLTTLTRGTDVVAIGYDTAGRRKTVTLPNSVVQTYGYDDTSRLTSIGYTRSTATLGTLTHDYTPAGLLGHLGGTYARADVPAAYGPATYDDANQLTSRAGTTYAYDNDGNQTTDGTTASTWNARGELTTATRPGQTSTYSYDGLGRRIATTVGGTTKGFLHDGNNVVQELAGGSPTANLLTGGTDEVFTRTSAGATRSLLTDHLGSTLATTDTTGTVTGEYGYQPFGATTVTGDDGGNPTRFTGRDDDGNNQYFYRGRSYNTTDQRFLSQDPIGFAGGDTNLHAYVGNQPTEFTDPMGTNPKSTQDCLGNSFTPDTLVLMADRSTKPISDIKPGDEVLAGDPSTGRAEGRTVEATIQGEGKKQLVDVSVDANDDGTTDSTVTATGGHPFWVAAPGEWRTADQLKTGDLLRTAAGTYVQITAVAHRSAEQRVHNLNVDDLHTYYVLAGSTPVLVHNTSGPCAVDVTVTWLPGMPKGQFSAKTAALRELSDNGVLRKAPNPVARDSSITNKYKANLIARVFEQFGKNNPQFAASLRTRILTQMNPDHVWELQLGGPDVASNLHILDAFTNQRIGGQIWGQIRGLADHTPIRINVVGP